MTSERLAELKQMASGTTCWMGVALVKELIAEVERLQSDMNYMTEPIHIYRSKLKESGLFNEMKENLKKDPVQRMDELVTEIDALRAQFAAAREVIEFYRDGDDQNRSWPSQIMVDGGRKARAWLEANL